MTGFKTAVRGLIGVVVVVLIPFLSCPDEDSFNRWASKALVGESGSGLEKVKDQVLLTQANWTADYRGHALWATVDAYQGTTKRRYIGVVGTWVQIGSE